MNLYTIGYEGRTIDEFVAMLKSRGVEVLADVRELPLSRKKGFSKTALGEALAQEGIQYKHFREVGNPKHIRKMKASPSHIIKAYDTYMSDKWDDVLGNLSDVATSKPTCLMCFELEPVECHRTSIAKQLISRHSMSLIEL